MPEMSAASNLAKATGESPRFRTKNMKIFTDFDDIIGFSNLTWAVIAPTLAVSR